MEYTFSGEINNFQVLSLSWYNEMPRQEKEGTSLFPVPGMIQMRSDESQEQQLHEAKAKPVFAIA
jgi:hypothetical protein